MPTNIKEIVGEKVHLGAKMRSGKVILLVLDANESLSKVKAELANRDKTDELIDLLILDAAKIKELENKTEQEIGNQFNAIKIPEIPNPVTEHTLEIALELCRQTEIDLMVREKLARNQGDRENIQRVLKEIDERKKLLKKMLKEEVAKLGPRSIFRRR